MPHYRGVSSSAVKDLGLNLWQYTVSADRASTENWEATSGFSSGGPWEPTSLRCAPGKSQAPRARPQQATIHVIEGGCDQRRAGGAFYR